AGVAAGGVPGAGAGAAVAEDGVDGRVVGEQVDPRPAAAAGTAVGAADVDGAGRQPVAGPQVDRGAVGGRAGARPAAARVQPAEHVQVAVGDHLDAPGGTAGTVAGAAAGDVDAADRHVVG